MFEGCAEQVDLISLLSTGEARGANSLLWMCLICVKNVAAAVVRIYFELCCLIVGETFFQPTQLSGFVLNGKVKVMLLTMCSLLMSVQSSDGTRKRTYLRHSTRAVLSWDSCLRGLSGC